MRRRQRQWSTSLTPRRRRGQANQDSQGVVDQEVHQGANYAKPILQEDYKAGNPKAKKNAFFHYLIKPGKPFQTTRALLQWTDHLCRLLFHK